MADCQKHCSTGKPESESEEHFEIVPAGENYHDPCLQPQPPRSNGTNANFWFYYNQDARRCEVFPYDGHIKPDQNRFEFFHQCFSACENHMKHKELQVKDQQCLGIPITPCKRRCTDDDIMFTFNKDNMERQEIKGFCCVGNNLFGTLNHCRKSCHFSDEEEESKEEIDPKWKKNKKG